MKKMILLMITVGLTFASCGEKSKTITKKAPVAQAPVAAAFTKMSVAEFQVALEENIEKMSTVRVGQKKQVTHSNLVVHFTIPDDNDAEDFKSLKSLSFDLNSTEKASVKEEEDGSKRISCVGSATGNYLITKVDVEANRVTSSHALDFVPHKSEEGSDEMNDDFCFEAFPQGDEENQKRIYTGELEYELRVTKENIEAMAQFYEESGAEVSKDNKSGNYLLSYSREGEKEVKLEVNLNNHHEDIEVKGSIENVLEDGRSFINDFSAELTQPDMTCEGIDCGEQDDEDGSDEDGSDEDGSDEDGSDEDGSDEDGSDEDETDEDGSNEDDSSNPGEES